MSATPKTDALFFPYGRDATAAAEPSLLVCMTQYELLEREIAASRKELKECSSAFAKCATGQRKPRLITPPCGSN